MSESGIKKCPKCGGEMEIGFLDGAARWKRGTNYLSFKLGERIFGYRCKGCNYVEFYAEK